MNVLLVRADGIGDALVCAPLVAALRDAGHAVGAVLGTKNHAIYARGTFAAVHVLERIPWPQHGSTPESRKAALAEVRSQRYDIALVASEEMDAYIFARDAAIPRRIGYLNGWENPFKTLRARALLTKALLRPASALRAREHEAETMFRLGAQLSPERAPTRDPLRLRPLLLDLPARAHGSVVLQISRKLEADGLDLGAYVALARELIDRGLDVVGVGEDADVLARFGQSSGAALRPGLDVPAWKTFIGGARALVTPDSGAAHVAGMLGVPCVDCFPPRATTARDILRWHPWAAPYRAHVLDPSRERSAAARAIVRDLFELAV